MKTITLTRGLNALVDDEDFDRLNQFQWQAKKSRKTFYAARTTSGKNGQKRRHILMHREILLSDGEIDHKNGDGLDNRKENLRPATEGQNTANARPKGNRKLKGVYWYKRYGKWNAQICVGYKRTNLGYFNSEVEAIQAYNEAAQRCFGEFARLNPL